MKSKLLKLSLLLSLLSLSGCIGAIIETTTDAAIAVAKVPFKVGGAVVDVVTGDDKNDFTEKNKKDESEQALPMEDTSSPIY